MTLSSSQFFFNSKNIVEVFRTSELKKLDDSGETKILTWQKNKNDLNVSLRETNIFTTGFSPRSTNIMIQWLLSKNFSMTKAEFNQTLNSLL